MCTCVHFVSDTGNDFFLFACLFMCDVFLKQFAVRNYTFPLTLTQATDLAVVCM